MSTSASAFRDLGVDDAQAEALARHYDLLVRWNRVLNLTRIENLEEAIERHYGESLFLAKAIPDRAGLRIADVGSGAGFPGFPVAVVHPEAQVTLIESHRRKAVFLREAARNFPNIRVLAARAEDISEPFDWLISRAVSYDDLTPAVRNFGARVALLTGAEEPPAAWNLAWDVNWLRFAKNRFLRVSRETAKRL